MSSMLQKDQATSLRNLATRERAVPIRPPVVCVTSGKGGAGKTVMSVNLALHLAARNKRVLLVDLDPGLANVDVHMRLRARFHIEDILNHRVSAQEAVIVAANGLWIIPGCSASRTVSHTISQGASEEKIDSLYQSRFGPRRVLEALEPLYSKVDMIILDTGAGLGPWVLGSLELTDHCLTITQPDPASVTDAYALLKICHNFGFTCTQSLIVNRVRDKREALITASRLRKVAKRFLDFEPGLLGWLHDLPEVTRSVKEQSPFVTELPGHHQAKKDLAWIAARVMEQVSGPCRAATLKS